MALGRPYPRSRRSVLSEVGCLCKYLNLGALHRYFELYNAFGFSYLIAYTTIVSLGRTVNTNANVFRIGLGSFRLHVRRIEGAVFAVHLIWLEAPLVQRISQSTLWAALLPLFVMRKTMVAWTYCEPGLGGW